MKHLIDMKIDLIYYEDLDCTTPFIVRIRTDNQADAINTRISRGKSLCFLIYTLWANLDEKNGTFFLYLRKFLLFDFNSGEFFFGK